MTVINTNVGALTARTYSIQANDAMQKSMERLSSGLRINSAADDAAGLAVANKMESQLRGMNVAIRNSQDGISLVQTAEAGMGEISNMVIRMRELAVQMNNGVYTSADRSNAQLEVAALLAEIDKIADNTAFNDVKVLDGSYSADIRAGNTNAEIITVTIDRMKTDTIGGDYITTGVVQGAASTDAALTAAKYATNGTTVVTVKEGDKVTIDADVLSGQFGSASSTFKSVFTGGTFSLTGTDAAKFDIDANGDITSKASERFDKDTKAAYNFNVVYTHTDANSVVSTFTDKVTLNVTAADAPTAGTTGATQTELTVAETDALTLDAKTTLSRDFIAFVEANAGGTFAIENHSTGGANDAGFFEFADTSASAMTLVSGKTLNFENKADTGANGKWEIKVSYTAADGVSKYSENVGITATNVTSDDTVQPTTALVESGAGTSTIAIDVGTTAAGGSDDLAIDFGTSAVYAKLSAGAQKYIADIVTAGGTLGITGVETTDTNNDGAITGDTVTVSGNATNSSNIVYTLTLDDGSGNAANQWTEVVTLAVTNTGNTGDSAINARSAHESTAATTALTGASSESDGVITADLTSASFFPQLTDFVTAKAGGTYAITSAADAAVTLSGTTLSIVGNASKTVAVTYTDDDNGNTTFTQTITVDPTDLTHVATGATAAFVSSGATTQASQTSTELTNGKSNLTFEEARQGSIKVATLSSGLAAFTTANTEGTYTVTGTDKASFDVDAATGTITTKGLVDYETKTSYDLNLVYTKGDKSYTEVINVKVNDSAVDAGTHLKDVSLATADGAATAVTILDKALGQISSSQAKLGAIQNRLTHNIDNLSMASMLTETARGRVVDADFARETSELSKQQILAQAATSMLAQANQSKQSVLALLQ
jgi:flagellin